ncbi:hypothetical protein P43SY_006024 [Pythium insidiosum]|uniref:Tyrosine-protein kinase ephrin type A/B receptor-like domain-containing protein n=1 Tax=Pythium insidiosum TaxID=114742 RepID=A0AAD5L7S9_PYTIN|nr:hypothetical protein P43SY_006024 [Pythium insidiosum]
MRGSSFLLLLAHYMPSALNGAIVCLEGSYLSVDQCRPCPAGTYGGRPGLDSPACSGPCAPGYFCPAGSTSATPRACGSARFYCPQGSGARRLVDDGYYTMQLPFSIDSTLGRRTAASSSTASQQLLCEPGFFCANGIRQPCPPGTYGDRSGLTTSACAGPCPPGYYCPRATAVPIACPAGTYGGQPGLSSPTCSAPCPLGHYCEVGTVTPRPCPAGTFGGTQGLTTKRCSATCSSASTCTPSLCPAGFFCPLATVVPKECGGPDVFCPEGSVAPTPVSSGFYTTWSDVSGWSLATKTRLEDAYIEGGALAVLNLTRRSGQRPCERGSYCVAGVKRLCPAGTFGDTEGLATPQCSAPCPSGFFCPLGTARFDVNPCNDRASFCRQGAAAPTPVSFGYFTVTAATGDVRVDQQVCPIGSYCVGGIAYLCPPGTYGSVTGLTSAACSGRCQDGYTCAAGSTSPTQTPCPAGHYARNGVSCAPCSPGYWCTSGSPDPMQNACGSDTAFCPLGSSGPQSVAAGHYAVGQQLTTHTSQRLCDVQSVKHVPQCPTRTVGVNSGL